MFQQLRAAVVLFVGLTLVTGLVYPVAVTGLAQVLFPAGANGSLIERGDRVVGSRLIGQPFGGVGYFWSRPSATSPSPYNAAASSGSNLGPLNPALTEGIQARIAALHAAAPENKLEIPVDLVTASASGLDPHITPAAAEYQVARVARERQISEQVVRDLVRVHTSGRQWGFLGEPRVNVLELNLALAAQSSSSLGGASP